MALLIGAVADDFTGATDLANTLVQSGLRTVQVIGVPQETVDLAETEAVVVALKSRTAPVAVAVSESLAATDWLIAQGARQVLSKYCSTFDSTPKGNIGPIADAMMHRLGTDFALVCPAFPGAGRTIYQGHLFVLDKLLGDSPMKDHPLTPMRDSDLIRLMAAQSNHAVGLIDLATVRKGADAILSRIAALKSEGKRYGVSDVVDDADLLTIGRVAQTHTLVTGGSGIAMGLPAAWRSAIGDTEPETPVLPTVSGRTLVLAGSCSAATREQIRNVPTDWPKKQIDAEDALENTGLVDDLMDWLSACPADLPCLIYSSADPDSVARAQAKHGVEAAGAALEAVMGAVAKKATAHGFGRLIVAGGETSGAVVSALNVSTLRIGPQIAVGVPWCEARDGPHVALALKSGNFGGPTFFTDALDMFG